VNTEQRARLERFFVEKTNAASASIARLDRMSGGAVQENWSLDVVLDGGEFSGTLETVLRCDAASSVSCSHSRSDEFSLLKAAFSRGVMVPEPLWLGRADILGRKFFVMRKVRGIAAGHRIVKDETFGGIKERLAESLGQELAKIHEITPPHDELGFLPLPEVSAAQAGIAEFRSLLDQQSMAFPALEWGIRWLELNEPAQGQLTLVHRDFRTGNYMVDEKGLTAILDWEFTGWGNPMEDIGWFCARCWRFGRDDKAAGGISSKDALLRGYRARSGRKVELEKIHYWEVYAHVRWAIIAIGQGQRHVSGKEPSLELALTAHIVPDLELEILRMTGMQGEEL